MALQVQLLQSSGALKLCDYNKYTIIVSNTGTSDATNVPVSFPIPYKLSLKKNSVCVSNSSTNTISQFPYSFNSGVVSLIIPLVQAGSSVIVNITCEKCSLDKCQNTYTAQATVAELTTNEVNALNRCNYCTCCECQGC